MDRAGSSLFFCQPGDASSSWEGRKELKLGRCVGLAASSQARSLQLNLPQLSLKIVDDRVMPLSG